MKKERMVRYEAPDTVVRDLEAIEEVGNPIARRL